MMDWYGNGGGWGGWISMMVFMVVFWGLVIFVVVTLFRGSPKRSPLDSAETPSSLEILDRRFALGEIDAEEYHARREALEQARRGSLR